MIATVLISSALALPASLTEADTTHFLHTQTQPVADIRSQPRPSPGTPDVTVYGYIPNWISNPLSVDFDSLTHAAWFSVGLDGSGNVTGAESWNSIADDLVAAAHASGTKVHLTLTVFDDATQSSVLANPEARARAVTKRIRIRRRFRAQIVIEVHAHPAVLIHPAAVFAHSKIILVRAEE